MTKAQKKQNLFKNSQNQDLSFLALYFKLIFKMAEYRRITSELGDDGNANNNNTMTLLRRRMRDMIFDKEEHLEGTNLSGAFDVSSEYKKPIFMVDDMESTFINMKKSFEYVGDNSTFQKRITWILVFNWIAFSFMVNSMAYFFRNPNFACKLIPLTNIYIPCSHTLACSLPPADIMILKNTGHDQLSIVEEFELYCDQSNQVSWAQAMFFLGGFVSGYLFSYISERVGRRPVLLFLHLASIVSIGACAFSPTYEIFIISYFLVGFFLFGYETNIYIYIGEISAIRFRTISINMLTMVWAGTPMFLPFLSFIPTWRHSFMLFAALWIATLPFAYKRILESPRFLLSKKCYSQVRDIFQQISVTNRRPPYAFKLAEEIDNQNQTFVKFSHKEQKAKVEQQESEVELRRYNYFDLFKYASVKKPTLILMYCWLFRFFMYFGLNLALESVLQSGFMLTMAIALGALSEVIGSFGMPIMTTFFFNQHKLDIMKKCLMVITICCCVMYSTDIDSKCRIIDYETGVCIQMLIMIFLVILIKFFNSVFFSGLIVYSSEVYPTVVRSLGYGFTLTFGRIATIIVPFYVNYMRTNLENKNSISLLAPFALIGYLLCRIMPNTETQGMRETIKEEEDELNYIEMDFMHHPFPADNRTSIKNINPLTNSVKSPTFHHQDHDLGRSNIRISNIGKSNHAAATLEHENTTK